MTNSADPNLEIENRILVLAPTGKDGVNSQTVLGKEGISSAVCRNIDELCFEIDMGAAAILLTEEAAMSDLAGHLSSSLGSQPPWSDLPVILLTREGSQSNFALHAMKTLGNVILIERPVRVMTLVTAAQTALRARKRQYQNRENLLQLKETDRRKDEFLAMLAHELRNPLAPVRNAIQIMKMPGATSDMIARARDMTERQVVHMTRIIDDLLEVSRVSRGKIVLKREFADLGTALSRAADAAQPFVVSRNHRMQLSLPSEQITLHADPARLEQIFSNLLTNAAKYTPKGGDISISAKLEAGTACIRVRDTGVGIAPDLLPRVFELFVQAEQGSDRSQGGLGIGLTLVKSLVEMHGGRVEAQSEGTALGSEFIVRLPTVDRKEQPAKVSSQIRTGPSAPKRILVVDDNVDAADSLSIMLRLDGHEVRAVDNGTEALETAAIFHPEVVFLDIGLPGMNGYDVARGLRRLKVIPRSLIVAVTGYGQDEDRKLSKAAGFDRHLVEPPDPIELSAILRG